MYCLWFSSQAIYHIIQYHFAEKYMCKQECKNLIGMMTSSNGNIFHVTCPLWGESTVTVSFPSQRPVTRSFDVLFDLRLNKQFSNCNDFIWWGNPPCQILQWSRGSVKIKSLYHINSWTKWPPFWQVDDIVKCIFLNESDKIPIWISLKFVPRSPIDNKPALVQVVAWRRTGEKPLSEPMMSQFSDAYMRH